MDGWQGRFPAGKVLADRYRIVAPLGRGGMGEVWRADDLKLRQTVALKFLPESLATDPSRLTRLVDEVRLARQVSHPNVCRVHDLAEAEGQHFVTMEYVDGEDLRSLLRRVGRLPTERAVDLLQQVCRGLGAAHERGILHRDLKPANILVDGRGRARITDFGLALTAADARRPAGVSGTPAYMAPEQRAGRSLSPRTDVYALGHLLREMLTGLSTPDAASRPEHSPPVPLDIDHLIQRCLADDPALRPPSALAVAAALPGRDVLGAMIAAGETPPPEIVAAAGTEGGLRPAAAWACIALLSLAVPLSLRLQRDTTLFSQVPLPKAPAVLAERARETLGRLGHTEPRVNESHGFTYDEGIVAALETNEGERLRNALPTGRPAAIQFWYRAGVEPLLPRSALGSVTPLDAPPATPGTASVRLDTLGRLVGLAVGPSPTGVEPAPRSLDWAPLLEAAGLDPKRLKVRPPDRDPPLYADARAAWEGTAPEPPHLPLRIEAAALRGRPVWLDLHVDRSGEGPPEKLRFGEEAYWDWVAPAVLVVLPVGLLVAVRNVRLGRGDRAGGQRLALVVFGAFGLSWLLSTPAPPPSFRGFLQVVSGTGNALWFGVATAVFYLAGEPALRRRWPELLISWSRLLAGRWRDPRVGRDVLLGMVLTFALTILVEGGRLASWWLGGPAPRLLPIDIAMLGGFVPSLAVVLAGAGISLASVLSAGLMILMLLLLLRRRLLVVLAFVPLVAAAFSLRYGTPSGVAVVASLIAVVLLVAFIARYGVLAGIIPSVLVHVVIPPTVDLTAWYGAPAAVYLLLVALLTLYGFLVSLGDRPALSGSLFGD
jgi:eukaryotic-like serine/threonine-protein kinase